MIHQSDNAKVVNGATSVADAVTREADSVTKVAGTADYAARAATRAAIRATADVARPKDYSPSVNAVRAAARADYKRLLELMTEVADASETGPLGSLWQVSTPEWYVEAKAEYDKTIR